MIYPFPIIFLFILTFLTPQLVQGQISEKEDVKICLTMIVKNESRIIQRCLNSVIDLVDCISICDTGSTDNTVELIEDYLQKNNILGKVHHHQWQNFGYNRTLSVEKAQQTLCDVGLPLENTYLLFLDADMILEKSSDFKKKSLIDDCYLILQKNSDISYYNLRLARASMPWKCIGVTHEYWSSPIPHNRSQLSSLAIDDKEDGGSKADKFERDIRLLKQGLQDEPENERYMFYLAQSYRCLGDHNQAIEGYKKRIDKGGWREEVWYSKFMIAECYKDMNQYENAIAWYLEAYEYLPSRAETLQKLANYYRLKGKNELAYIYAKHGSRIPFPKDQLLFISHPVYDYQFDEELSIVSYYTGCKDEGLQASHRLMLKKNVPQNVKSQAFRNLLYYIENLKNTRFKTINIELPYIQEGSSLRYNPTNPSIQRTKNGYQVICRTVNYIQFGAVTFKPLDTTDPNFTIRTRNFLLNYDREFNLLSQQEIVEELPRNKYSWRPLEGLEDCRLFNINQENWFTCSMDDATPNRQVGMSLCKLSNVSTGRKIQVDKLVPLIGPNPNRCEKNWLPFTLNNQLHMIYGYDPLIIYQPDLKTGSSKISHSYVPSHDFSSFRGSAAPIEFDEGYLMMVHEYTFTDQRIYFHRFVYLDKDFVIQKVSKPFVFRNKGVEFCLSMTIDHSGTDLIMGVGSEDREAHLCFVDLSTVRNALEILP